MHNNKLITILKHFSKSDFNQFNKFIHSPYFNKSKQLLQFYLVVEKGMYSSKPSSLEKENIWRKLFSDQKYNDVRFRKLSSDLLKLIEAFMAQQIYDTNKLQKASNLIQASGLKGIKKMYSGSLKISEGISKKHVLMDSEFYYYQYLIQKNYFEIAQHEFKNSIRHNLDELDHYLTVFFLTEKLRCYCNVLSQNTPNIKYNVEFDEKVLELARKFINEIPAIAIYYQIYLTYVEENNQDHYFKLKELLIDHGDKFHSVEARALYDSSLNYCVIKNNQGHTIFLNELFELYEDYIKKEAIYVDGEIHPFHFKNIVTAALRLGKFEWTNIFLLKNKDRLPKESRENAFSFNLARLHWYKKDHDKVISLLQEIEYEDIVYNLSSKAMLLATYYETDEIEPLYSLLESFRAYLNRKKEIPERWKKNYSNLVRFTKRLIKILPGDNKAISKIRQDIENTPDGIADVKWLKEKIAELEK